MTPEPKSRAPIQFKSTQIEAKLLLRAKPGETVGSVAKTYLDQYLTLLDTVDLSRFGRYEIEMVAVFLANQSFYDFVSVTFVWVYVEQGYDKLLEDPNFRPAFDYPELIKKLKTATLLECLAMWDLGRRHAAAALDQMEEED